MKTVRIAFQGSEAPTEAFISQCSAIVPGIAQLHEYGMTSDEIQDTLRWVSALRYTKLPQILADTVFADVSSILVLFYQQGESRNIENISCFGLYGCIFPGSGVDFEEKLV